MEQETPGDALKQRIKSLLQEAHEKPKGRFEGSYHYYATTLIPVYKNILVVLGLNSTHQIYPVYRNRKWIDAVMIKKPDDQLTPIPDPIDLEATNWRTPHKIDETMNFFINLKWPKQEQVP